MPKLKTINFAPQSRYSNDGLRHDPIKLDIHVSTDGEFYSNVPEYLNDVLDYKNIDHKGRAAGKIKVYASSFDALVLIIQKAVTAYFEPEVTEEPVILYNIESHASFAEDESGNIFPNAGYPGAKWPTADRDKHGGHNATHGADGGYSLTIGAVAMIKRTVRYGEKVKVLYPEFYYKGGGHHGHANPAQILNSWTSFYLDKEKAKEIPYSDESALFFHSMMLGISTLCKRVQDATFDTQDLVKLIESGQQMNLLTGPKG